ncbi:DUF7878 domain-containing protein [Myceligenerans indicum]|uniref:DUF7878 domain-containing protein n=1 Tax=Myceligenerans indicum TaxID=2593663 RepID=A0ABS1LRM7_9MICO|nr:hypothetical protein [Myceligenerans indicum]MBL0888724.1 hypothetical protein [Myceligenerans indicum]
MTGTPNVDGPDGWFRLGGPNLTNLRAFHATGGRITRAELLLYVEADLEIRDGDVVLFDEPQFEVAALAHELTAWAGDGSEPGHDFEHSPDGYEESGIVRITRTGQGWAAGSCFTTATTTSRDWETVKNCIDTFMADVRVVAARSLIAAGWTLRDAVLTMRDGFGLSIADATLIVVPVSGQEREFWALQEWFWDAMETLAAEEDQEKAP